MTWVGSAFAAHRLESGDVVEVSVFRVPELNREVTVDIDGNLTLPPLGDFPVRGRNTEEVAGEIRQRLRSLGIFEDASVTVAIVAVRPVVVGGDVANPGAVPFEENLTVRRAIAMVGGTGLLRERRMDEAFQLQSDRIALKTELLREQARLVRVTAELEGGNRLDPMVFAEISAPDTPLADEILRLEQGRMESTREEAAEQKAYLERTLELVVQRLAELDALRENTGQRIERQVEEFERLRDMQGRGLTVVTRVSEESRILEGLRKELSETNSDILLTRQRYEELSHQIERFEDRRRMDQAAERQASLVAASSLESRLEGIDRRLLMLGFSGDARLEVTVYRRRDGTDTALPADEETVLEPGDFVEVETVLPTRYDALLFPSGPDGGMPPNTRSDAE